MPCLYWCVYFWITPHYNTSDKRHKHRHQTCAYHTYSTCKKACMFHESVLQCAVWLFALVPVKADGEKRSQRSQISPDNSSLSWAVRLKELWCCITTWRHLLLTIYTMTKQAICPSHMELTTTKLYLLEHGYFLCTFGLLMSLAIA